MIRVNQDNRISIVHGLYLYISLIYISLLEGFSDHRR